MYHSTLGLRVIKKKKDRPVRGDERGQGEDARVGEELSIRRMFSLGSGLTLNKHQVCCNAAVEFLRIAFNVPLNPRYETPNAKPAVERIRHK